MKLVAVKFVEGGAVFTWAVIGIGDVRLGVAVVKMADSLTGVVTKVVTAAASCD